jgi:hypothetical protein
MNSAPILTDPMDSDSDNDQLSDGEEINTYATDPTTPSARLLVTPTSVSFYAEAGSATLAGSSVTLRNTGVAGTVASVTLDRASLPAYVTVTPTSLSLPSGSSATVHLQLDPSGFDADGSMQLSTMGSVRIDSPNTALPSSEIAVSLQLEGSGLGPGFGFGCTALESARAGAACLTLGLVLVLAALQRRRSQLS